MIAINGVTKMNSEDKPLYFKCYEKTNRHKRKLKRKHPKKKGKD